MAKTEITGIAPFFIVRDVPEALKFYHDKLGFDITFQGPSEDDIFFGIVQRGAAMIILKAIGVDPVPNYTRDIKQGIARWMLTSMFRILMRWRQNSHREMSNSLDQSKTARMVMMAYGDLKLRMLMGISCSSGVLKTDN
jgi:hypothetical protein